MSLQQGLLQAKTLMSTAVSTSTSEPINMPRALQYSLQVTAQTTGTSGVGATVVFQGSNDRTVWVAVSSATATASQAATSTAASSAVLTAQRQDLVWGRAVLTVTGTGSGKLTLGE